MQFLKNVCLVLLCLLDFTGADTHGQGFLGKRPKVHADSVRSELTGVVSDVLGHGHGVTKDRLARINSTLLPIFRSLPKNNRGHISEPIMKYAIRRYFSATHAWIVKGFEEHADAINASYSEQDILQSRVPGFVRSALEQRFQHQGFTLDDMVSMVAVVETLAFNEVVRGVELSFHLNSLDAGAILSQRQLQDVMDSYLIIEMLEGTSDIEQHNADKSNIHLRYPNWDNAATFLTDISGSDGFSRYSFSNPFTVKTYTFEDVVRMAGRISEEFGPWSSYECHDMKDILSEKDVHETGRVKLSDFYRASKDGAWQFLEPSEYLRQLGALDESSSYLGPQVIIPNYITGMSNCITSAPFFSICCLNECDLINEHIESEITSPNGTVSQILNAVETLPSFPEISEQMRTKLEEISILDGGSIPLHGRLFAQWLHFTFPRDCPYPHAAGSITPKTQMQWREMVGDELESVTDEEIKQHIETAQASRDPSPDAGSGMWNFQEALMEFQTPSDNQDAKWSSMLCFCCQLMIIGTFGSILVKEGIRMYSTSKGNPKEYKI
eukprot:gnl/MRDRNA2_/MRDRNA2_97260_c0_seq1.p1 gnl/MRDRNA2_/MRDRNA2_97260_c0~~gnl/MRDRNA2_/MRDRNA2_97260_c0_seq1.p1  ORF type:complete len:553 (-),score=102.45 gnl/MRDRNA2_/MRDRNA2_97260_c0_seq1:88-1746(-)